MALKILNQNILNLAIDAFDGLLDPDTGLAKPCLLVYPSRQEFCSDCRYDPIGRKSSGYAKDGSRINGVCPVCDGRGTRAVEVSETIYLTTEIDPKAFEPLPINIRVPAGALQIKGYITDLPKLQRCEYIIHDTNIRPYIEQKFKLMGESVSSSSIVRGRYFSALMERA